MSQVSDLLFGLKSRNVDTRRRAVRSLYHFARTDLREMPQDTLNQVLDDFNFHIHAMISSYDSNEKKGGILTIVCLIGGDTEATRTRTTRYANYLRNVFPSSDLNILELAAKTMGRLATSLGVKRGEYIEFEIKRALEWLNEERHEGKRISAVLILKELAIATPTYFFQQINNFFNYIMLAVRDPKAQIREGAAKALRAALVVAAQRENSKQSHKAHWYIQCYEEAVRSFSDEPYRERNLTRDDHLHGALLLLNELLRISNSIWEKEYTTLMQKLDSEQECMDEMMSINPKIQHWSSTTNVDQSVSTLIFHESAMCKQLITEKYEQICSDVMAQQICRSQHVQQTLLIMIPRLAAFNTEVFIKKHLKSTINHLITYLRSREKEKVIAFTTLGLIAVAVGSEIKQYLNRIIDIIKVTMPVRETPSKKRIASDPAVFLCITLLAYSVRDDVASDVKELLDPMCSMGLSPLLTTCLKELSNYIPSLRKDISDRLLNMLSIILRKKPYTNFEQNYQSLLVEPQDASKLILALYTLGSFDFEWHNTVLSFIKRCVDHYLQSDHQEVRLEAVRTTSKLLLKASERASTTHSNMLINVIDEAIAKLLVVSVTDFDHEVRCRVFESLNNIFDPYLAQVEHLSPLFVAMNDENLEVRELACCTLGRLSTLNPAYVTPTLRRVLIQLLIEMEHSGNNRNKEQAIRMLDNLILSAPRMIRPYIDTILNVLVPKLRDKDSSSGVIISALKAIGDIADINGDGNGLNKWTSDLLAILMELLSDSNPSDKRSVALWSFGQIISATGLAVTPYRDYPNLMSTLLNFLKTEQQPRDRRETIRVLGILGALDPYQHRLNKGLDVEQALIPYEDTNEAEAGNPDINKRFVNMSTLELEEFYPAAVVPALMRVLRDQTLSQHHTSVVQAITFIFQSLGIKCVPYIALVIPSLLNLIETTDVLSYREFLFTQLAKLISIVKQHIRDYLDKIFEIIKTFWTPESVLQPTIILLVEHIAVALGSEFKVYLPQIVPQILRVLNHDTSKDKFVTERLLLTLQKFEENLDDYLHLVISAIVKLFEARDCPLSISKLAMETVDHLSIFLNFSDLSSRIIHPLVRVLDMNPQLRATAMDTLCALIIQLGHKYNDYIPGVERVIAKHKIQCINYQVLISKLQYTTTLAADDNYLHATRRKLRIKSQNVVQSDTTQSFRKLTVNVPNLRRAWTISSRLSKDDWMEWLRRLSAALLTESHSPELRACSSLAHNYPQLANDLFNAAFVSCWTELDDNARNEIVIALEQALTAPDCPELTLTMLNLAEFMEHCEKGALPIPVKLLGQRAITCRAYAKALYYKEEEYRNNPSSHVIEELIHINNKLQQQEAAYGLLERVMNERKTSSEYHNIHVRWYEKLHNWEQALELYNKRLESEPKDPECRLGQMRCLEALGEWCKLNEVFNDEWSNMDNDLQSKSAKIAAAAAWGLQQWDTMSKYVDCISEDTLDGAFYRAILAIHENQWANSRNFVEQARTLLDSELTAVVGESYQRAYTALVSAQLLAELEEVVTYKLVSEKRNAIRQAWWLRLQGGQRVVEDWRKILQIRSLVVTPQEELHTWLKYTSLCRKSGAITQAQNVLSTLTGWDSTSTELLPMHEPRVILAHVKLLWVSGQRNLAYQQLQRYVDNAGTGDIEHCRLLARCHLKLGSWCESLHGINEMSIPEVLKNYRTATILAPDWYKAWHTWAYMNFETVLFYKQMDNTSENSLTYSTSDKKSLRTDYLPQYIIPAVEGFLKSINLSQESSLQDTLRLLTLWFDYGHHQAIYESLFEGVRKIEINIWLQVIPQLIARIDTPRPLVAKLIHSLLVEIGKAHPQALVYPLTVASKSSFAERKTAANEILKSMCIHSQNLVTQAAIISEELVRVAILWHDQWFIALDEASRLFYSDKDYKGMLKTLEPLHAMLERGPQTLKEISFLQTYGRELREAQDWCNRYKETGNKRDLNQAWDYYYHVFRRINSQFRALTSLELPYVSPRLLKCQDLELAVPGSYVPNQDVIKISFIHNNLQVIKSKQRPRRLTIRGSNGSEYMFLLKGHEDLRQDERVMQLFGLVNTLLQADPHTFRRDLAIQRYSVVPLSTNSGLIGWVPHCDTLYNLISDYRRENDKKPNRTPLTAEQQIMAKMASDLHKLTLMQKVEVFEYTLSQTPGNDLARLLWLKSPSSEVWFERRTNYTRSLAVMSMVGYILGLGDRHPSNIILHRDTGKVLHIDFGDCFEVTLLREKFPEKIPFRLTRMLINAMEVTGIEGTYRSTCELVMEVLHKHKDNVMAVLEAFVYDPLLNWRLVDTGRHSMTESSLGSSEGNSPDTLPSRSRHHLHISESMEAPQEINLNKRAVAIVTRVKDKLTGNDFVKHGTVNVKTQVDLLIKEATNNENLCQCYMGWCPFW